MAFGITAQPSFRLIPEFVDQNGKTSKMGFWMPTASFGAASTGVLAVIAALTAMTNAALGLWRCLWEGTCTGQTIPTGTLYTTSADKAYLVFRSTAGNRVTLEIPAPIDAIVSTSNSTQLVTATGALDTLITAVLGECIDASGNSLSGIQQTMRRHSAHVKTQVPGAA
jgi:hypothetical protein